MYEVVWHGRGGQGVVIAAQILAESAYLQGFMGVTSAPTFGPERRGAPLEDAVQLCGSSFELDVRRHRLFECSFPLLVPPCAHYAQREQKFWNGDRSVRR